MIHTQFREPPKLTFNKIMAAVVAATRVSEKEIMGKCRVRHIKNARWMVAYLTRKHKTFSYPHIARLLGMKDHTSIMHACEHFLDEVRKFPEMEDMLDSAEYWISEMTQTA